MNTEPTPDVNPEPLCEARLVFLPSSLKWEASCMLDGVRHTRHGDTITEAQQRLSLAISDAMAKPRAVRLPVSPLVATEAPQRMRLRLERDLAMQEALRMIEQSPLVGQTPATIRDAQLRISAQFQRLIAASNWLELRREVRALAAACIILGDATGFCSDDVRDDVREAMEQRGEVCDGRR